MVCMYMYVCMYVCIIHVCMYIVLFVGQWHTHQLLLTLHVLLKRYWEGMCVFMFVCMCVCTYIHKLAYAHTHTHTSIILRWGMCTAV